VVSCNVPRLKGYKDHMIVYYKYTNCQCKAPQISKSQLFRSFQHPPLPHICPPEQNTLPE